MFFLFSHSWSPAQLPCSLGSWSNNTLTCHVSPVPALEKKGLVKHWSLPDVWRGSYWEPKKRNGSLIDVRSQVSLSFDVSIDYRTKHHRKEQETILSVLQFPQPNLIKSPREIVRCCDRTDSIVLYDTVWHGMVWYGMVWYGIAWHAMLWYESMNSCSMSMWTYINVSDMIPYEPTCYDSI